MQGNTESGFPSRSEQPPAPTARPPDLQDFIVTLRDGEPQADDGFHRVFVVETKRVHLKDSEDTEYKRSVFDICGEHVRKADWAEFVPAMRTKAVRFEVVDEDEWQARLNGMLFPECA